MPEPRVPLLRHIPEPAATALREVGGRPINLYRALANHPDLLKAWIGMAWTLRLQGRTPRALRELVILRCAQVYGSEYEWAHHEVMARAAGVPQSKIAALAAWRRSEHFSAPERAALAYAEGVMDGDLTEAAAEELTRHFDAEQRVELTLTAAFYAMVARVLDALAIPLENE
jgi:alkylhydroperoxidase family enzyme